MDNFMTFLDGESAAKEEIKIYGFNLELWNNFLEHPEDFKKLFSKALYKKSDEFIEGYKSYYSSYALWADTISYRDNLPSWRTPWKDNPKETSDESDINMKIDLKSDERGELL